MFKYLSCLKGLGGVKMANVLTFQNYTRTGCYNIKIRGTVFTSKIMKVLFDKSDHRTPKVALYTCIWYIRTFVERGHLLNCKKKTIS